MPDVGQLAGFVGWAEMGKVLGLSIDAVKSRLHRARARRFASGLRPCSPPRTRCRPSRVAPTC
jgi:hypothetical protein